MINQDEELFWDDDRIIFTHHEGPSKITSYQFIGFGLKLNPRNLKLFLPECLLFLQHNVLLNDFLGLSTQVTGNIEIQIE